MDIVELSIIDVRGEIIYSQRLKPACPISPEATKTHGLTLDMLSDCPSLEEEWNHICDVVGGRTVIAWNAWFDSGRIEESLALHGLNPCTDCTWNWQCAMVAYAEYWNAPPDPTKKWRNAPYQKLQTACEQQGLVIPQGKWHGALFDIQATLLLLQKIAKDGARTYQDPIAKKGSGMLGNFSDEEIRELLDIGYIYCGDRSIDTTAAENTRGTIVGTLYEYRDNNRPFGVSPTTTYRRFADLLYLERITFDDIRASWLYKGVLLDNEKFCGEINHIEPCPCGKCTGQLRKEK